MKFGSKIAASDITEAQFRAYVTVQYGGRYNMFDPNARMLTGLSRDIYIAIMEHYEALMSRFPKVIEEAEA